MGERIAGRRHMKPLLAIWRFLFPPSRWAKCKPQTPAERLAQWEVRRGQDRAEQRLREARMAQAFDYRSTLNLAIKPKLPADRKVVEFKQRRSRAA